MCEYNSSGQMIAIDTPEGSSEITHDPQSGAVSSIETPEGQRTELSLDGDLPVGVAQSGPATGGVSVAYDDFFRVSSIGSTGHTTAFGYDADSLLVAAGDLQIARDQSNGKITGSTLSAINSTTAYNEFAEPVSNAFSTTTGAVYDETYTRDAIGRIVTKQVASSSGSDRFDYEYDAAGRLTEVKKNDEVTEAYEYDLNSNRTSTTYAAGAAAETKTATFDNRDRMTTYGNLELAYNADGELTSKTDTAANQQTTFEYSTFGRLRSATLPGGQQITYITDGLGNRVARQVDGQTTSSYLYAPGMINPVAELDENGNLEASFIYATKSHSPDYMVKDSVTYRMISDQLGSIRLVVNAQTGAVVQELEYDTFGQVLSDSNPGFQPFAFAGGLYDSDTRLTHFGAREYDAELGRWTSSDPIGFAGGDSNLYGYVVQDPVNLIDPSGLYGFGDLWSDAKGTVFELDDTFKRGAFGEYLSNYSAGALNTMSFGLSNRIAGVSGECAGPGYGFGSFMGSLVPVGGSFKRTSAAMEKINRSRASDAFSYRLLASLSAVRLAKVGVGSSYRNLARPFLRDSGSAAGRIGATEAAKRALQIDDGCGC